MWNGKCTPRKEPKDSPLAPSAPTTWPGMAPVPLRTSLEATAQFLAAFKGGGCAVVTVHNNGDEDCRRFALEANIHPAWGGIATLSGAPLLSGLSVREQDLYAGAPQP